MKPLKKTNTVSTIAAVVLFIAMVAYLGVYIRRSAGESVVTSPAVEATLTETAEMTGIAVRAETVVSSDRAYVFVNAGDGKQVSKGYVLASAMDSEAALERAGRRHELENEISHMETLLSGIGTADDLTERDSAVRRAVLSLSASVSTGDLSNLDSACVELSSLVFTDAGGAAVTQEDLDALESELAGLENGNYSDSEDITAPESGLFTTVLDGYESLTPDELSGLTPAILNQLYDQKQDPPSGAIGKLITDCRWYFAAVMDKEKAGALSPGDYVDVSFGRHYSGYIQMRVERVSSPSGEQCAVVLSTLKALDDTAALREADAEVVCSETTGLRVPTKAVHVDDDGRNFVYVVTAKQAEVKYVKIILDAGDYCLIEINPDADSLREGNEIIVSGKNVYEGMIIE